MDKMLFIISKGFEKAGAATSPLQFAKFYLHYCKKINILTDSPADSIKMFKD